VYDEVVKTRHENIEQRLRRAVLESGLSRYQIARISGVSEAQLSFFVNRKRTLTLPVAAKLAEALGLELRPKKRG
jgi:transcriptional regulator with XRE-family HTH domain